MHDKISIVCLLPISVSHLATLEFLWRSQAQQNHVAAGLCPDPLRGDQTRFEELITLPQTPYFDFRRRGLGQKERGGRIRYIGKRGAMGE